jgi:hypothetical protein
MKNLSIYIFLPLYVKKSFYFQVRLSMHRSNGHTEHLQKNFNTFSYPWGNGKSIGCNLVGYKAYQCYLFDKILSSLEVWTLLNYWSDWLMKDENNNLLVVWVFSCHYLNLSFYMQGLVAFSEHGLMIRWWSLGSVWWEKLSRNLAPVQCTKVIFVPPWEGFSPNSSRSSIMASILGHDNQANLQVIFLLASELCKMLPQVVKITFLLNCCIFLWWTI